MEWKLRKIIWNIEKRTKFINFVFLIILAFSKGDDSSYIELTVLGPGISNILYYNKLV